MTTEAHSAVLPALTDGVNSPRFGARFVGVLGAPNTAYDVLDSKQLEGLPGPVSVHLFRPDRVSSYGSWNDGVFVDNLLTVDAHARITYSNGAAQNTFYCDWDSQFSIVCSRVRIELEVYLLHTAFPYTAPVGVTAPRTFGALIGLGACPSGGADAVSFTSPGLFAGSVPAITQSDFSVPDFARRWFPVVCALGVASFADADLSGFRISILTARETPMYDAPLTRKHMENGLPIPAGAAKVRVDVPAGILGCSIFHIFRLGL
jgi:hypothetical protein